MTVYSCKRIVKHIKNEVFTYHGEWELPVQRLRLMMPAGEQAEALMGNLKKALTMLNSDGTYPYIPVPFNGKVEYTDKEGNDIELPAVVRVYGPEVAVLEASVNDELSSQSIFYNLTGNLENVLAAGITELDKLLQNRSSSGVWLQRDIVCILRKPNRSILRGGVGGTVVPFQVYAVVSKWNDDDCYSATVVPATLVTEGAIYIPDSKGYISIHTNSVDKMVLHGDIAVLTTDEAKRVQDTVYDVLREKMLNTSLTGLTEYGQNIMDKLTGKNNEDACDIVTEAIESKKVNKLVQLTECSI